jgi:hypothetical protein
MNRQFNLNTVILTIITALIALVSFLGKRELERIDATQRQMWLAIMPRHEIEIEIQTVRSLQLRLENDQYGLRERLTKLEVDVARISERYRK